MFQVASVIIVLAALASFINAKWLRLPTTVGVMLIALAASVGLVVLGEAASPVRHEVAELLGEIHFDQALLHGMLAFLLFAGALHVELNDLARQWVLIALLSVVGTAATALLVGCGMHVALAWLGLGVPWLECFLFGALISPTDPVAVLGIMKSQHAPKAMESQIAGESLFNDGVGVVLFLALLAAIGEGHLPGAGRMAVLVVRAAGGGVLLGLLCGGFAYLLLKRVDNYQVEVLLTLALAMGCYAVADEMEASAPVAVVVAGLLIGNHGRAFAMSPRTKQRLDDFWELVDDILNVMLFVLVGMHVLVLPMRAAYAAAGAAAVVICLAARWACVAGIVGAAGGAGMRLEKGTIAVLTWSGLRGGLSLAMALALPGDVHGGVLSVATYAVVVFSVLVQGLTIGPLLRRVGAVAAS